MKSHLLLTLAVAVGGCVVEQPSTSLPASPSGNIDVLWTFADGGTCESLPNVAAIQVDIPGQELANGGAYPCNLDGTQGVQLADFDPGPYSISVTAVDANQNALFQWSGTVTVNTNVEVDALLTPVAPALASGSVTFSWTFADGSTCASLGGTVADIQIQVDGLTLPNQGYFPCETAGAQSVVLTNVPGGSYTSTVNAINSSQAVVYTASGPFTVNGNTTVSVTLAAP